MMTTRKSSLLWMSSLLIVGLAIFSSLDATPFLYIAEKIVTHNPSLLQNTFNDTVTLITGASDGIGAETARQLCAKTNTKLIFMARNKEKLNKVQTECHRLAQLWNTEAKAVIAKNGDVTQGEASMKREIQKALRELNQSEVDIAIINAGRTQRSPSIDTHEEVVRSLLELNVLGAISTSKAVMSTYNTPQNSPSKPKQKQKQKQKQKHMIVVSSVAGKMPVPLQSTYAASKAAMIFYFDSLRAEHPEIRITTVCPGPVATNIALHAFAGSLSEKPKNAEVESLEVKMPLERSVQLMLAGSIMTPYWLFHELWFSPQPYLTYVYVAQYIPDLTKILARTIGPKRVEAWRKGESIY